MDDPFLPLPVKCVSDLITAAQRHLERFGDTSVVAIIESADPSSTLSEVESVTSAHYDQFEEDGEHVFTVEALVPVTPPLGPIVAPPSAMGPSVCSKLKDNVDFVHEETPDA